MKRIFVTCALIALSSFILAANLINENISNWTSCSSYGSYTQNIPAGTVNMTRCIVAPTGAASGTGTTGYVQMEASTGIIQLPAVSSAGTAEFHIRAGGTGRTVKLQGYDGSTWDDLATFSNIGTTGATYYYDLNVSSSTTIRLASPSHALYVHDIIVTDYGPSITVTGTLNSFSTTTGTASAYQSYKVSGTNLSQDISVAAPTGFEICKTNNGTYSTSLTYAHTSGTVAEQDVFVRIAASASVGSLSGSITHTSSGATQVNKAVSGTVYKAAPTNHATNFTTSAGTPSYSTITATWDDATDGVIPDGYLIKGSNVGYSSISDPNNGTAEADGTLVKNVAAGIESVSFTGLAEHTTYYFKIFPYTNSGSNIKYKKDGTVPTDSEITTYGIPAPPETTAASSIGSNGFTAHWNSVEGATGYRLDVYTKSGSNASDLFISEYIEGNSNNKAIEIFNGTGNSVDLSNYRLELYNNGSSTAGYTQVLSSTLANNDVYVVANSSAVAGIKDQADLLLESSGTVVTFNGNDALALHKISTNSKIDIFGMIGQNPDTGGTTTHGWQAAGGYDTFNKTLVRKSNVTYGVSVNPSGYADDNVAAFETLSSEWSLYDVDTATYLGAHTFNGLAVTPVSGYPDKNVNNVTSYEVNGLNADTQYYYVVRAYNGSGTSGNSTEIAVKTINYDYPNGNPVTSDGVTVTFNTGDGNNSSTGTSTAPNPNFTATFKKVITLVGSGPWNITLSAPVGSVPWFAYRRGTTWTSYANTTGTVTIDVDAKKDAEIEIQGGSGQDPTLPVELSSFMATLTAQNTVSVMWVTQSETNVNGYYVYRGMSSDLQEASTVSPLIPATNTSQQQMYQFTDSEVFEPGTYYYWLQVQDLDGSIQFHGPTTVYFDNGGNNGTPDIPKVTELKSVYPNPFNPSTTISYSLAKASTVDFVIYNNRGQIVRSFNEGSKGIGNHSFNWFGDDQNGRACSTGVYYIKMNAGKDSFIRKAVLMK